MRGILFITLFLAGCGHLGLDGAPAAKITEPITPKASVTYNQFSCVELERINADIQKRINEVMNDPRRSSEYERLNRASIDIFQTKAAKSC